jgi:hypothetical protein
VPYKKRTTKNLFDVRAWKTLWRKAKVSFPVLLEKHYGFTLEHT